MKKTILAVFLFSWIIGSCRNGERADLPDFNLLLIDSSTILKTSDIPMGKPIVFLFFSPDCEHCQAETTDLLAHIDSLKDVRLFFVTIDRFERLRVFQKYYHLDNYPNITLTRDYQFFLPKYFEIAYPPYNILYNKNKTLKIAFEGKLSASALIKALNKLS